MVQCVESYSLNYWPLKQDIALKSTTTFYDVFGCGRRARKVELAVR